jgi:hypothetical protein
MVAAGWYPDPAGSGGMRYFDGTSWTEHVDARPQPPMAPQWAPPGVGAAPVGAPIWTTQPPKGRRIGRGCLIALAGGVAAVALIVIVVVALAAAGAHHIAKSLTNITAPPAASAHLWQVGQTAPTSGWQVTVYGVRDPATGPVGAIAPEPRAGDRFVAVDVQVANPGSQAVTFASFVYIHLFDAANRVYDEELIGPLSPGPPEGSVTAHSAIRGWVTFEVPSSAPGPLRLRIQGSIDAAGAVFQLEAANQDAVRSTRRADACLTSPVGVRLRYRTSATRPR